MFLINLGARGFAKMRIRTNLNNSIDLNEFCTERIWKHLKKVYRIQGLDIVANFDFDKETINPDQQYMIASLSLNIAYLETHYELVGKFNSAPGILDVADKTRAANIIDQYHKKFEAMLPQIYIQLSDLLADAEKKSIYDCPNSR